MLKHLKDVSPFSLFLCWFWLKFVENLFQQKKGKGGKIFERVLQVKNLSYHIIFEVISCVLTGGLLIALKRMIYPSLYERRLFVIDFPIL